MNGSNLSLTFSLDIQIALDLDDAPAMEILQSELEACLMALAQTLPEGNRHPLSREMCVRLCDEAESQALNRDYRDRDKPTNVLPLGDLAICWPIVVQEARQQYKTTSHHLSHLFIHGVLHLMGWDHEAPAEALAMEKIECAALAQLNIADPYISEVADG